MQGRVIELRDGQGRIMADDGHTYAFMPSDVSQAGDLTYDATVDFVPVGDRATQIVTLVARQPAAPSLRNDPQAAGYDLGRLPPRVESESFVGYFKQAMTRRYADFRSRARRTEYWSFVVFSWLIVVGLFVPVLIVEPAILSEGHDPSLIAIAAMIPLGLVVLALIIPNIAVTVRRFHDTGLSGWLYLVTFIPYVGGLFQFVISVIPGQKRINRWGPPPR